MQTDKICKHCQAKIFQFGSGQIENHPNNNYIHRATASRFCTFDKNTVAEPQG
jgi:hypothetical protein